MFVCQVTIAKSDVNLSTIKWWTSSSWQHLHLHGRILPTSYDKKLLFLTKICNKNFFSKTFFIKTIKGKGHPLRGNYDLLQKFEYEGKKLLRKNTRCASLLSVKSVFYFAILFSILQSLSTYWKSLSKLELFCNKTCTAPER